MNIDFQVYSKAKFTCLSGDEHTAMSKTFNVICKVDKREYEIWMVAKTLKKNINGNKFKLGKSTCELINVYSEGFLLLFHQ